jgi:hypothetical protein
MNSVIKQVQKLTTLVLAWVSLPIFLLATNPEELPLPLLIVPFILLLACLYVTAKVFLNIFFKDIDTGRRKTMAAIFAVLPTLLILLASINQLTVRDTAIVLGLLVLLLFYLRRLDFLKNM